MGSNSFGQLFRITTWGESHGRAVGVIIDGCPAGLPLSDADINQELERRKPGRTPFTSPRAEKDEASIYSGVFEGKTTGTPLSIMIPNLDIDSNPYIPLKNLLRPGHANYTYVEKYGTFDYRGSGRASARETACRVAAGAVAKKLLVHFGIHLTAYIQEIGGIGIQDLDLSDLKAIQKSTYESPIFCPDKKAGSTMMNALLNAKEEKDSLGGIVACIGHLPACLGDPIYEKLEANLAKAMMTIPASKGFEIGSGFAASRMKGSEHNDSFTTDVSGNVYTETNFAGGTLGGISTGMPLHFRVAFKPTSSIKKKQTTVDFEGKKQEFEMDQSARQDPCVAIRAVPVVEAMAALVLADAFLMNRVSRLSSVPGHRPKDAANIDTRKPENPANECCH